MLEEGDTQKGEERGQRGWEIVRKEGEWSDKRGEQEEMELLLKIF